MLGNNRPLISHHIPAAIRPLMQFLHPRLEIDFRTTDFRRFGISMRCPVGIKITIRLVEHRANKITVLHHREELFSFLCAHQFGLEA